MIRITAVLLLFTLIQAETGTGLCGLTHTLPPVEYPVLYRAADECNDGTLMYVRSNVESSSQTFEQLCFYLVDETADSRIYVEDAQWNSGKVSNGVLNQLSQAFNHSTPNAVMDELTYGIKTSAEWMLGPPPNMDGSGITNILLLDVRDNFSGGNYVAGYFDPHDQTTNAGSNQMDIVYLDCEQVQMTSELSNEAVYTLAHEYQHLLHYASDPYEGFDTPSYNPWLDEGLADLTPALLGIGHRKYGPYLNDTSIGVDLWESGGLEYYAKSALFIQYFYEVYGLDGVAFIFQDQDRRIQSLMNYLGGEAAFNDFFDDFVQAAVSGSFPSLNCVYGVHPQFSMEASISDGSGEPRITAGSSVKQYSIYHVYIPGLVPKNEVIEMNDQGSGFLWDIADQTFIQTDDPGVWILDSLSHPLIYTRAFHLESPREVDVVATLERTTEYRSYQYDNDDILFPITGPDRTINRFSVEGQAVLTQVSFMCGGEESVTIKLKEGSQSGVTLFEKEICQPLGLGWTEVELTESTLIAEDEDVYVDIELGDNSMAYSSYFPDNHSGQSNSQSFYVYGQSAYQPLTSLSIGGSSLTGNWMIRLNTADTDLVTILPEPTSVLPTYPNPFNLAESDLVQFEILPEVGYPAKISIYNILGQHIRTVYNDWPSGSEPFTVTWGGRDRHENAVPSGLYLVSEEVGGRTRTSKILLIR